MITVPKMLGEVNDVSFYGEQCMECHQLESFKTTSMEAGSSRSVYLTIIRYLIVGNKVISSLRFRIYLPIAVRLGHR